MEHDMSGRKGKEKRRANYQNQGIISFLLAATAFAITIIIYSATLSGNIVAAGDAPEFMDAVLTNGMAHPSGYPMFLILGKLATVIFPVNKILTINSVSAIVAGLTCVFVSLSVYWFTKTFLPSLIAGLTLGFSGIFWKYSLVSEVFTLNSFFASAIFFLALSIKTRKGFCLLAFLMGLSLTNHLTIVLVFPAVIFILWYRKVLKNPKQNLVSLALFTLGLTPYIYLYVQGQGHPLQSWGDPTSLRGLADIILRRSYATFRLIPNQSYNPQVINQLIYFIRITYNQFTLLGVLAASIGTLVLFRINKLLFSAIIYLYLATGILFILFAKAPLGDFVFDAISERFFLLPNTFFTIAIGIGTYALVRVVSKRFTKKGYVMGIFLSCLAFFLPTYLIFSNMASVNQKNNQFVIDTADDIFSTVPQGSLLLVEGDIYQSSVLYAYQTEGKRQDISLVFPAFLSSGTYPWYIEVVKRHFPDVDLPEKSVSKYSEYIKQLIQLNLKKRTVVCACGGEIDKLNLGIQTKSIGLTDIFLPDGDYHIKTADEENEVVQVAKSLKNLNSGISFPASSLESSVLQYYAKPYIKLAFAYREEGDYQNSERLFNMALSVSPQNYPLYAELGDLYLRQNDKTSAKEAYKMYIKSDPFDPRTKEIQTKIDSL